MSFINMIGREPNNRSLLSIGWTTLCKVHWVSLLIGLSMQNAEEDVLPGGNRRTEERCPSSLESSRTVGKFVSSARDHDA